MEPLKRQPEPDRTDDPEVYRRIQENPIHKEKVTDVFVSEIPIVKPGKLDILDIGCSLGAISLETLKRYPQSMVTGIDINPESIEEANKDAAELGLSDRATFLQYDATELPFDNNSFDIVMSNNVVPHQVPTEEESIKIFKEMRRVSKNNNGTVYVKDTMRPLYEKDIQDYMNTFAIVYKTKPEKQIYEESIKAGYLPHEFESIIKKSGLCDPDDGYAVRRIFSKENIFNLPTYNIFTRISFIDPRKS